MAGMIHYRGPWHIPYKATGVLCSDGVRRTCMLACEADTFFTIPARVRVRGKTVSGYVMYSDGELCFVAYTNRKNGHMLPKWPV